MRVPDAGASLKIGDGPGDAEHAIADPGRQTEPLRRSFQQLCSALVRNAVLPAPPDIQRRVETAGALQLMPACTANAPCDQLRGLGWLAARVRVAVRLDRTYRDQQFDAIQKRTGYPLLITPDLLRRTLAGLPRIPMPAARTRIHGRDQLHVGREFGAAAGP